MSRHRLSSGSSNVLAIFATIFFLTGTAQAQRAAPDEYPAEADRVHVVLLADTTCNSIGNSCARDVLALRNQLTVGFGDKRDRLVFHDLTAPNPGTGLGWNAMEILTYLDQLPLGPNETIVIYHSGHGSIARPADPEGSQVLGLNHGYIVRGKLRDLVRAKAPRASIFLTDCCSGFRGMDDRIGGREQSMSVAVNRASILNLFLRIRGEISITAARDGTNAVANFQGDNPAGAGSAFTVALLRLLANSQKTYLGWEQLYPALQTETLHASGGAHQARAFVVREETLSSSWGN